MSNASTPRTKFRQIPKKQMIAQLEEENRVLKNKLELGNETEGKNFQEGVTRAWKNDAAWIQRSENSVWTAQKLSRLRSAFIHKGRSKLVPCWLNRLELICPNINKFFWTISSVKARRTKRPLPSLGAKILGISRLLHLQEASKAELQKELRKIVALKAEKSQEIADLRAENDQLRAQNKDVIVVAACNR